MTDFFSADLHLGHFNIIKYCNRPFSSIEEMDKTIIDNINSKVGRSDRLFCLGDFCFKSQASSYLNKIVCKNVWLIKGNHDYKPRVEDGFAQVLDYYEQKYDIGGLHKKRVIMFHYPILEWNQWYRGSYMLFGHVHGKKNWRYKNQYGLDVGVDSHSFSPLSFDEVHKIMQSKSVKDPILIPDNIRKSLSEIMDNDDIEQWWVNPIDIFEGQSPRDIFLDGQESRIWQIISMVRSGHPL